MEERRTNILTAVVREYIRRIEPIGSGVIHRRYRFGVSPATIRNELLQLTREGYLEQPHASAGRIPTNRGWRFYVDRVVRVDDADLPRSNAALRAQGSFGKLASRIAEISGVMGVCMVEDGGLFLQGVARLFSQPDFEERAQFERLAGTLEALEHNMEQIFDGLAEEAPNILVGRENKYFPNDDISCLFTGFVTADNSPGLAMIVGPKRMRYEKNWNILKHLEQEV